MSPRQLGGILISATSLLSSARADLVHRWSFNNGAGPAPAGTVIADSVSGSNAVVVGVGAVFSGSSLTLPGGGNANSAPAEISAYVDLPNGLVSTRTNLTVEAWVTLENDQLWQRVFDFGRMNIAGMGAAASPGEIAPDATVAPGA